MRKIGFVAVVTIFLLFFFPLADGVAGGGENIHAVEAFPGPAVGAPQVAIGVATHAVATAGFEVVELLWAFDFFSVDYVVGKEAFRWPGIQHVEFRVVG